MTDTLSIYMVQSNPTVGAVKENCEAIAEAYARAIVADADLVLTPELSVTGYPLEDLVLKPYFVRAAMNAVESLAGLTEGDKAPGLLVGAPWRVGDQLFNAVLLLEKGKVAEIRFKHDLPNYGVFDEKRVFDQGPLPSPMIFRGFCLGVMICEDMWYPDVTKALADRKAEMLLVPTCSPFELDKQDERHVTAKERV